MMKSNRFSAARPKEAWNRGAIRANGIASVTGTSDSITGPMESLLAQDSSLTSTPDAGLKKAVSVTGLLVCESLHFCQFCGLSPTPLDSPVSTKIVPDAPGNSSCRQGDFRT